MGPHPAAAPVPDRSHDSVETPWCTGQHVGERSGAEPATGRVEVVPPQSFGTLGSHEQLEPTAERVGVEQQRPQPAPLRRQAERDERVDAPTPPDPPIMLTRHASPRPSSAAASTSRMRSSSCMPAHRRGAERDRVGPPLRRLSRQQDDVLPSRQGGASEVAGEVLADDHDRRLPPRPARRREVGRHLGHGSDRGAPAQRVVQQQLVGGGDQGSGEVGHTYERRRPERAGETRRRQACGWPKPARRDVDPPILNG